MSTHTSATCWFVSKMANNRQHEENWLEKFSSANTRTKRGKLSFPHAICGEDSGQPFSGWWQKLEPNMAKLENTRKPNHSDHNEIFDLLRNDHSRQWKCSYVANKTTEQRWDKVVHSSVCYRFMVTEFDSLGWTVVFAVSHVHGSLRRLSLIETGGLCESSQNSSSVTVQSGSHAYRSNKWWKCTPKILSGDVKSFEDFHVIPQNKY